MLENGEFSDCDTLFLDRDGVINRHRPHDYVKNWEEFEFLPGVLDDLARLARRFKRIIVVTNQRGVAKGLMSEETLHDIHRRMKVEIERHGGRVDAVYTCTDLSDESVNRKPNIGMALQARRDFPEIDFSKSLMIGDSASDIEFGRKAGMKVKRVVRR